MALIRDEQGRVLILEHTYRHKHPWGLPGGYLQAQEDPALGLAREVTEETGLEVEVGELLAAGIFEPDQIDLLYRVRVISGRQQPSDEVSAWRYAAVDELGQILPNQLAMLRRAGQLESTESIGRGG